MKTLLQRLGKKKKKLKVVVLGAGTISSVHIDGWNNIEVAELSAVFDKEPTAMEKYPELRHYTDFDFLHVVYNFGEFDIDVSAGWFSADYPFTAEFLFSFERAVVALEGGNFKIYTNEKLAEGELISPGGCPYERELRYFADCVIKGVPCDKVSEESLYNVLEILDSLNK